MTTKIKGPWYAAIIVASWLILLMFQPLMREYRDYVDAGPWFSSKIVVDETRRAPDGGPIVLYTKQIDRVLNGAWSAWLQTIDGEQITYFCGGSGRGIYAPQETGTRSYSLRYFLGQNCPIPEVPYRLCAEWIMDYNGRSRFIGPVCSSIVPTAASKGNER